MAIDARETFCRHVADRRLGATGCRAVRAVAGYVRQAKGSKALADADQIKGWLGWSRGVPERLGQVALA